MTPLDQSAFHWINHWPEFFAPLLDFLSDGIKHLPLQIILAIVVIAMIWRGGLPRRTVIQALLAWPIANGLTDLFKHKLPFPRPCVEMSEVIVRTGFLDSPGTASAHSANMAAIATVWMMMLGPRWGAIWIGIALLTGLSRIYVGLHYPSQVLLGWICGIFAGWAVVSLSQAIFRQPATVTTNNGDSHPETA